MATRNQYWILIGIGLLILFSAGLWTAHHIHNAPPKTEDSQKIPIRLSNRLASLDIINTTEGPRFRFIHKNEETLLTPDQLTLILQDLQQDRSRGGFLFRIFDITSTTGLFWIGLGFLGQFLFTGRMIVQWFASEKAKRSIVPTAFWWMSLGGSSLLMIYFTWRVDIVGVLGQATGWIIYLRNLWLIQRHANSIPPHQVAN